jgi:hypothetical protein
MTEQVSETTRIVCYIHNDRETMLRCNRCNQPICTACAVLTPTGYRCKPCVRGQQKVFETTQWYDYPLAMGVAALLSFAGSIIASYLGFFTLFIAPVAGVLTAEAVRWVVRKRRSRLLFQLATAGAVLGALPILLNAVLLAIGYGGAGSLFRLLWPGLYTFLVATTMYSRLGGIRIR